MDCRPRASRMTLALVFAVTAFAGSGRAADLPFAAVFTYSPGTPVGPWVQVVKGSGFGTYIGKSKIDVIQTFAIDPVELVIYFSDEFVVTAANGDTLTGTGQGTVDLATGLVLEEYEITGGTGAYKGVTGSGTGVGLVQTDGTVRQVLVGTLSK